jgi:adenylosuccinate lyase
MNIARYEEYVSPFSARYTSKEMSYLFSAQFKISTFRQLWVSLAKAEKKLGLTITDDQIAEMSSHVEKINWEVAKEHEKQLRHDVMAHIHAYAEQCPKAKPIIHLGATSSYVTDNTDLIQLRKALTLLLHKLIHILRLLANFAEKEAASPCLGYTHFQPAQPTTMGKRASLWLQDFLLDAHELERAIHTMPFLGAKGATGTQASFLSLFEGDEAKVKELEKLIAHDFAFTKILPISGQTYTRKLDIQVLNLLMSFSASAHKMGTDIRLLSHTKELSETPTETQVGSSAMPYKKNPIYSERICGLSRFVMSLSQNPAYTTATQWLERSLDDSSNKRLSIPEAFLGTDAILNLLIHLLSHLTVNQEVATHNIETHISQLASETILMYAVKKGLDRQNVHEILRKFSNHSIEEISKVLHLDLSELNLTPSSLTGRAPNQVSDFLHSDVLPFLSQYSHISVPIPSIEI